MRKLGFDPGAMVRADICALALPQLAETRLDRQDDGALVLRVFRDGDGVEILTIDLRADFLDEAIAQARAREAQDAA